jgi:hypothetical protein
MPKYDRQLSICVLTGEGNNAITKGDQAILKKGSMKGIPGEQVIYPAEKAKGITQGVSKLKYQLGMLTAKSRVYISGHGDWQLCKIGDVDGATMAENLCEWGLKGKHGILVSITACGAARGGLAKDTLLDTGAYSFAGEFHEVLHDCGVDAIVYARVGGVVAISASLLKYNPGKLGSKMTWEIQDLDEDDELEPGEARQRLVPGDDGRSKHKRPESKMEFKWVNGKQERRWVY